VQQPENVVLSLVGMQEFFGKFYPNSTFSFGYSFKNTGTDAQGMLAWSDLLYLSTTADRTGAPVTSAATTAQGNGGMLPLTLTQLSHVCMCVRSRGQGS
jgi:hypothetical protein